MAAAEDVMTGVEMGADMPGGGWSAVATTVMAGTCSAWAVGRVGEAAVTVPGGGATAAASDRRDAPPRAEASNAGEAIDEMLFRFAAAGDSDDAVAGYQVWPLERGHAGEGSC
jgi:hypothetical protein